ncbi:hypothetical protein [Candidatus Hodgkinia cicadicola]
MDKFDQYTHMFNLFGCGMLLVVNLLIITHCCRFERLVLKHNEVSHIRIRSVKITTKS